MQSQARPLYMSKYIILVIYYKEIVELVVIGLWVLFNLGSSKYKLYDKPF